MENDQEIQEKPEEAAPENSSLGAARRASAFLMQRGKDVGRSLPRLALFAFLLLTPLLITGYPAYYVSTKLLDYAAATTVEATLQDIEIRTVTAESRDTSLFSERRHIEVSYTFQAEDRTNYVAVQHVSWPAPGLARKLASMYEPGDSFVLYRMANQEILIDQDVAKETFIWLTALMALIFAAFAVFFLEWKRLYRLKPNLMFPVPLATAKSIGIAQLVALVIATIQAAIVAHAPVTIPMGLYLGIYWGIVVFLSLLLRLLVFESPTPPAVDAEQESAGGRQNDLRIR